MNMNFSTNINLMVEYNIVLVVSKIVTSFSDMGNWNSKILAAVAPYKAYFASLFCHTRA